MAERDENATSTQLPRSTHSQHISREIKKLDEGILESITSLTLRGQSIVIHGYLGNPKK